MSNENSKSRVIWDIMCIIFAACALISIVFLKALNSDDIAIIEKQEATIKHLNDLQEGLIKGEGYTVTRQENTDTVRYLVGSCVKKEVQMFVPVGDK